MRTIRLTLPGGTAIVHRPDPEESKKHEPEVLAALIRFDKAVRAKEVLRAAGEAK